MKTFKEFILEANKFGIPDTEYIQWQKNRSSGIGPARKTFGGIEYQMRNKARKGQPPVWAVSRTSDRKASAEKRKTAASNLDTDLSPKEKVMSKQKISSIKSKGGEHHHLTSLDQSAKEFAGLSPEQRREKRVRDAQMGKYHGNDRRNIAFTAGPKTPKGSSTIPHRGSGGYHSSQNKPVGSGGSVQDLGAEKDIQWIRLRRERQNARRERLAKEKTAELRARMSVNAKARGFD